MIQAKNTGNTFKGYCICGFIDILGFSNEVHNKWDNEETDNPVERLQTFTRNINKSLSANIRHLKNETDKNSYNFGCRFTTFSDSVVYAYCFEKGVEEIDILIGAYSVAKVAQIIWEKAIDVGFTVRGGIEYGQIFWSNQIIAGPSLIEAYKIEKDLAFSSRVCLGEKLVHQIDKVLNDKLPKCENIFSERMTSFLKNEMRNLICDDWDAKKVISPKVVFGKKSIIDKLKSLQKQCTVIKDKLKYVPLLRLLECKMEYQNN